MVFCPLIALLLLLSCSSNLTEQDIAQSQTEGLFENKQSLLQKKNNGYIMDLQLQYIAIISGRRTIRIDI